MGIEKFLLKISVQTAVYWGGSTNTGYGAFTYLDPVEIPVRWEEITEVITNPQNGVEYVSIAKIIVNQDVQKDGYLFLGTLDDIDSGLQDNPEVVDGAYRIVRFDKIPMIKKTDEFVRIAYI